MIRQNAWAFWRIGPDVRIAVPSLLRALRDEDGDVLQRFSFEAKFSSYLDLLSSSFSTAEQRSQTVG